MCLTYAIINPFILVVGIPYFFACHLAYKHQMLFVYEPLYETGGVFFPKIFRRFIFGLIIAQVYTVNRELYYFFAFTISPRRFYA